MINKKTYLILINSAFKMAQFHMNFGDFLKSKGHTVIYAIADKLPLYTEKINLDNDLHYVFSDFFKENYNILAVNPRYDSININKLFFSDYDRNVVHQRMPAFSQEHYDRLMPNLINFFDKIAAEHSIDICIYESISNSFAYAAYEVFKVNNIPYCGYAGSRLKGRFELFTEEYGSVNRFSDLFSSIHLNEAKEEALDYVNEFLSHYTDQEEMPTYHPKGTHLDWNHSLIKKYFNSDKIKLIYGSFQFMLQEFDSIEYSYQISNPFVELLRNFNLQIRKQIRIRYADKFFEKPSSEKYYIYPQHFKPESSTSVLARHYCDDISLIRNIAFNLPFGMKLYVKEHFVNFGKLSTNYYKELKKIPNVRLISHAENMKKLLLNCEGVVTLTSTVGFEALLYNKPVFVFGNVFYNCHPHCFRIRSYDELEEKLKVKVSVDKELNQRFLLAYYYNTIAGSVYYNLPGENFTQNDFNERFSSAINERFFS